MSENKVIGTFREKRGDDHYRVVTSHDGEVIGIEQYDAIGHRWVFLNLFTESAPALISLIRKAAGIKAEKVEYEYAMAGIDAFTGEWKPLGDFMERYSTRPVWGDKKTSQNLVDWYTNNYPNNKYKLVKRRKAGKVEDA